MSAPRRENDAKRQVTFNTTDAGGHVKPAKSYKDYVAGRRSGELSRAEVPKNLTDLPDFYKLKAAPAKKVSE